MGKKTKQFQKEKRNYTNYNNEREEEDLKEELLIMEEEEKEKGIENEEIINLTNELEEKKNSILNDFLKFFSQKGKKVSWLENLTIISDEEIDQNLNPDDDIKRELLFYNLAKQNAINGLIKLKKLGEKINRPEDYFVEMLKSDEQMANVKKQIIKEQQFIKKFEQKKQKLQNIKFAKSMKDYQNKMKSSFKRKTAEGIEKWKEHIKTNPNDYKNIDKFIDDGKKKKFNPRELFGKSVKFKSKEKRLADERRYRKKQMKRPGKVKRMQIRNKKNSKKGKK
jgi:rRNA-processing protein EBP2